MAPKRAPVARTMEEYLARLPEEPRAALERVRRQVHAAAPGATEGIGYGMPAFLHDGRAFLWLGAFRRHCTLFPGSLRFTPEEPLPAAVVRKLARTQLADAKARLAKRAKKGPARKAAAKATAKKPRAKKARAR